MDHGTFCAIFYTCNFIFVFYFIWINIGFSWTLEILIILKGLTRNRNYVIMWQSTNIVRSCDLSTFSSHISLDTSSNLISLISMPFSEIYCNILGPFVESYKLATNQKNRAVVIKNAVEAVLKSRHLLEDTGIDLPKDLNTVCLFPLCVCLHHYS